MDEKFPDSAFEMFESVAPHANDFILPDLDSPIKNLKKVNPVRVSKFSYLNGKFINKLNNYDALIIHGMNKFSIELINRCRKTMPVYWIGMGFDYYDIIYNSASEMLKAATNDIVINNSFWSNLRRSKIISLIKYCRDKILYPNSIRKETGILRVDYFCPVLESEFHSVLNKVNGWNPKYIDWNYANSSNLVDCKFGNDFSMGKNILLGNSSTPTNNHLDAIRFLKKYEHHLNESSKIIAPLSYGDMNYRNVVINEGVKRFGDRFYPLTEMLTVNEYNRVLESCGLVFMNHLRQQAGNNIAQALFMGARVILDSKNPFYTDYKQRGVYLNSIEDINKTPELLSQPLTYKERLFNRIHLRKARGSETALFKTKILIESINSSKK
ncbi:4-alpha-L-fucosyltransferase glycosyl transferase group 56 [Idiomarina zobellii]|nr:4-alpha-L-fucosyltransferase glycosyl transferase group 56 [Idiomarina zobellii]